MIERYNKYAKYEAQRHLQKFISSEKYWKTMSNALLAYDTILKQQNIEIALCDHFLEGTYRKDEDKIILCANTLVRR